MSATTHICFYLATALTAAFVTWFLCDRSYERKHRIVVNHEKHKAYYEGKEAGYEEGRRDFEPHHNAKGKFVRADGSFTPKRAKIDQQ